MIIFIFEYNVQHEKFLIVIVATQSARKFEVGIGIFNTQSKFLCKLGSVLKQLKINKILSCNFLNR